MRPPTGIAGREDTREAHYAVLISDLHPAQIILLGDALAIHRVLSITRAVPHVHSDSGEWHAPVGQIEDRQFQLHGHAFGHAVGLTETAGDVAANDAAL